jgi:hypothetical protein
MENAERDWTASPQPEEWIGLWAGFHDARPVSISSDLLARTVDLSLETGFPTPSFEHPKVIRIRAESVSYVCVFVWRDWPGPVLRLPSSEQDRQTYQCQVDRYRAKARVETISVNELADWTSGQSQNYIVDGKFAEQSEGVWLFLSGIGSGEFAGYDLRIVAGSLSVSLEDDSQITMAEFLKIGMAAWDEWGSRNRPR